MKGKKHHKGKGTSTGPIHVRHDKGKAKKRTGKRKR